MMINTFSRFVIIFINFQHIFSEVFVFLSPPELEVARYRDLPAKFGPRFHPDGLNGPIRYSSPPHACSKIDPPPFYSSVRSWIVVIQKTFDCKYDVKIRNAQRAGYAAAIVHNVDSNRLEYMTSSNWSGIVIPSIFVGETAGLELRDHYQFTNESHGFIYYVNLTNSFPFDVDYRMALVVLFVLGVFGAFTISLYVAKCVRSWRRDRRLRMPSSNVKKLPLKNYSSLDSYDTCTICMTDFIEEETIRILPCNHAMSDDTLDYLLDSLKTAYHSSCIDKWLTKHRRLCPTCRRKVYVDGETQYSDTDSDDNNGYYDDRSPLISSTESVTNHRTFDVECENSYQRIVELLKSSRPCHYPDSVLDDDNSDLFLNRNSNNGNDDSSSSSTSSSPSTSSTSTSTSSLLQVRETNQNII